MDQTPQAVEAPLEAPVGRLFPQREDDRALLERAAAAIGLRVYDWLPGRAGFAHGDSITNRWNPLFDDGDAFRLALALRISVWRDDDLMRVGTLWEAFRPDADVAAIARRLIVRAASMCGKPPN